LQYIAEITVGHLVRQQDRQEQLTIERSKEALRGPG
jgi:hypothetical protein